MSRAVGRNTILRTFTNRRQLLVGGDSSDDDDDTLESSMSPRPSRGDGHRDSIFGDGSPSSLSSSKDADPGPDAGFLLKRRPSDRGITVSSFQDRQSALMQLIRVPEPEPKPEPELITEPDPDPEGADMSPLPKEPLNPEQPHSPLVPSPPPPPPQPASPHHSEPAQTAQHAAAANPSPSPQGTEHAGYDSDEMRRRAETMRQLSLNHPPTPPCRTGSVAPTSSSPSSSSITPPTQRGQDIGNENAHVEEEASSEHGDRTAETPASLGHTSASSLEGPSDAPPHHRLATRGRTTEIPLEISATDYQDVDLVDYGDKSGEEGRGRDTVWATVDTDARPQERSASADASTENGEADHSMLKRALPGLHEAPTPRASGSIVEQNPLFVDADEAHSVSVAADNCCDSVTKGTHCTHDEPQLEVRAEDVQRVEEELGSLQTSLKALVEEKENLFNQLVARIEGSLLAYERKLQSVANRGIYDQLSKPNIRNVGLQPQPSDAKSTTLSSTEYQQRRARSRARRRAVLSERRARSRSTPRNPSAMATTGDTEVPPPASRQAVSKLVKARLGPKKALNSDVLQDAEELFERMFPGAARGAAVAGVGGQSHNMDAATYASASGENDRSRDGRGREIMALRRLSVAHELTSKAKSMQAHGNDEERRRQWLEREQGDKARSESIFLDALSRAMVRVAEEPGTSTHLDHWKRSVERVTTELAEAAKGVWYEQQSALSDDEGGVQFEIHIVDPSLDERSQDHRRLHLPFGAAGRGGESCGSSHSLFGGGAGASTHRHFGYSGGRDDDEETKCSTIATMLEEEEGHCPPMDGVPGGRKAEAEWF